MNSVRFLVIFFLMLASGGGLSGMLHAEDGLRFGPLRGDEAPGSSETARTAPPSESLDEPPASAPEVPLVPPDFPTRRRMSEPQIQTPVGGGRRTMPPARAVTPSRSGSSSGSAPAQIAKHAGALEIVRGSPARVSLREIAERLCRHVSSSSQRPNLVVADGNQRVQFISEKIPGGEKPDIALSDLRLERFARNAQGQWVLSAVVHEGALDARIFLYTAGQIQNFPVWSTPQRNVDFDGDGTVGEADWAALHSNAASPYDLDGDGRITAEDETIFVLNYLLENPCHLND